MFQDSDYIRDHEWLWQNFPDELRFHSVIVTGDNVLTPEYVKKVDLIMLLLQGTMYSHQNMLKR